ncbi:MAG: osmoprotectant NAGGN system M42 family peptidase [Gammaproteobacteria bacterium]
MRPDLAAEAAHPTTAVDLDYLTNILLRLLETPSPSGMTDHVVGLVSDELEKLGIPFELTRLGAIRADLEGARRSPDRAIVSHLDTLGAMVKAVKPNERLEVVPVGTWSARMAEGARVTVHTSGGLECSGTLLPLKASGHVFNREVDSQPAAWSNLECRLDELPGAVSQLGIEVGDFVSIEPMPVISSSGFVNSRHLDDKAGVAAVLAAAKAVRDFGKPLPVDCHLLFTIAEEVGVGASHILHGDVAELVSVDNGTHAPGQATTEFGVTVAMMDSSGPFDYHLTRHLLALCEEHGIEHARDIFKYYRSDAAAALEAGNDIRTALVCFGLDASHGHERVHVSSLAALATLLGAYMTSDPLFARDTEAIGPRGDLPLDA